MNSTLTMNKQGSIKSKCRINIRTQNHIWSTLSEYFKQPLYPTSYDSNILKIWQIQEVYFENMTNSRSLFSERLANCQTQSLPSWKGKQRQNRKKWLLRERKDLTKCLPIVNCKHAGIQKIINITIGNLLRILNTHSKKTNI